MTDKTCIFCDEIYFEGEKVDSLGLCECNEPHEDIPWWWSPGRSPAM